MLHAVPQPKHPIEILDNLPEFFLVLQGLLNLLPLLGIRDIAPHSLHFDNISVIIDNSVVLCWIHQG